MHIYGHTADTAMQSQSFWLAVNAATDMLEAEPVDGTFEQWMARTWPAYAKMCRQVAQHHYVMRVAHRQWLDEDYPVFADNVERQRLVGLCGEVGLDAREFVISGLKRHRNACLKGE